MRLSSILLAALPLAASCGTTPGAALDDPIQRSTLYPGTQTAARGVTEVEAGFQLQPEDAYSTDLVLKRGLTDSTEMSVELPVHAKVSDEDGGAARGAGDLTLGFTTRFAEETRVTPSLALRLTSTLPTGTEGIGASSAASQLTLAGSKDLASVVLSGELGLAFAENEDDHLDVEPSGTISLAHAWNVKCATFLSVAGSYVPEDAEPEGNAQLGAAWLLSDNLLLDLSITLPLGVDGEPTVGANLLLSF